MVEIIGIMAETARPWPNSALTVEVETVAASGVTAIIIPTAEAGSGRREFPGSEAATAMLAHQARLVPWLAEPTLLPAQFGSSLPDRPAVAAMLTQYASQLHQHLTHISRWGQIEVQVRWPYERLYADLTAETGNNDSRLDDRGVPLGLVAWQEQIEGLVRERLTAVVAGIERHIEPDLDTAVALQLLCQRERLPELLLELTQLQTALPQLMEPLHLTHTPICAPYRFAQIHIRQYRPELIQYARQLLGLAEQTTLAEMAHAFKSHPHYTLPNQQSELQTILKMTELTQAYRMLREVAQNQGGAQCHLDEAHLAATFVVKFQGTALA